MGQGVGLDHHRQRLALAERADAADLVAADPLGVGGLHHLGRLAADRRRQLLHRHLAVGRDDDQHRLAVDQGHQGLEHPAGILAQAAAAARPMLSASGS
jgi:hypothetical protein